MSGVRYPYYPGCSQAGSSVEYDLSTRALCRALGVGLDELHDWSCCGATPAHNVDPRLSAALSARNLNLVRRSGAAAVATPCPSCVSSLRMAEYRMRNEGFRNGVNALLDEPYPGGVEVKSILRVLHEDVGPEELAGRVSKPLKGLTVVPYYGCLTTRPGGIMTFDDEENPVSMDRLLQAAGATVPDFAFKTECCGASQAIPFRRAVARLSGRVLAAAAEAGADAVAVACPLCHVNLDLRRGQVNSANKFNHRMPVFYVTQLLGLALGLGEAELGIGKLCVDPRPVLGAWRAAAEEPTGEAEPCE